MSIPKPWSISAAAALALLGIYLQVIEWIDLHPWNNIRNGNGQALLDIALAIIMSGMVALLLAGFRWVAWLVSLGLTAWAILQIQTWWLPYFAGASPGWARTYARWFADNVQLLPSTPGHLPPDASHIVLHILLLTALAMSVGAALSSRPLGGAPRPSGH
jgi:hypothetical protein